MADMTTIKGRIAETIYPNGTGAITAESHQALLLEMVDNINEVKQDVLVSGQNIRPLISGESLLGGDALAVLGTAFIYEYESEQVFAMMNGTREEVKPWVLNRATASQVAQSISILRQNVLQAIVPVVIKTRAESAIICWEYDGLIYEIEWENDAYKVVTTPKGNEFDKEGNYPLLHVGTADDLAGRGESVPASFGFRASGGKSIKDGRAYIKAIKGNSVVWNNASAVVEGGNTALPQGARLIRGHKYLIIANRLDGYGMYVFTRKDSMNIEVSGALQKDNGIRFFTSEYDAMSTGVAGQENSLWWYVEGNYGQANLHDLTQMFGAGNEPSTIEEYEARKPIVEDEYAYNEGEVIHMTAEGIKSVGDNAWDEEWELGNITSDGEVVEGGFLISKNYIPALPNEQYAFNQYLTMGYGHLFCYDSQYNYIGATEYRSQIGNNILITATLPNTAYLKFRMKGDYGTTYNHDIMITLVHSGWKQDTDAGYQPYWQDTLPLPIIRKYFPDGMKSAGSAHDEIRYNKASGKKEADARIKAIRVKDGSWLRVTVNHVEGVQVFLISPDDITSATSLAAYTDGVLMARYSMDKTGGTSTMDNKTMRRYSKNIYVRDDSYADVASFLASFNDDDFLYYELAEPIVTELDAEDQNFRDYYNVADFGTEMSQSSVPSAAFSADIIYQFNAVDMIREHELEITELQKVIATMQAQLTSLINGGQ